MFVPSLGRIAERRVHDLIAFDIAPMHEGAIERQRQLAIAAVWWASTT
jgi:hypothetical protein